MERTLAFAPNISWLFPELPFAARPKAVADLGFEAIEFGFPSHADLLALEEAHRDLGLRIVLFNQDVPIWDEANRGYLADPARRDEYWRTLEDGLEIARRLEVSKMMLPAGIEAPGLDRERQKECMLENLRASAVLAADAGVVLTLEVLNPSDNPGYFLTSSTEALAILRQVNHPNVRFQFDTYHLEILEGHLEQTLSGNIDWIGHIQFADAPGRHEPGTGTIDFAALRAAAVDGGYAGYVGMEYIPLADGAEALAWVPDNMRRLARPSEMLE